MLAALGGRLLAADQAATIELPASYQAAVLVALRQRDGRLSTVLTQRHHSLPRHAGEVSFPGGRRDPGDASLIATALREAHEEIGLPASAVQIIGALEPIPTPVSDHAVYPFVGLIPAGFTWQANASEVEAVLEVELGALAGAHMRSPLRRGGVSVRADSYRVGGVVVWGATARMLSDLLDRMAWVTRTGAEPVCG